MATWLALASTDIDTTQILRQLPRVQAEETDGKREQITRRAIFFATPRLARLFEPNSLFYTDAINTMFGSLRDGLSDRVKLESVVAVVDAVPWQTVANYMGKPWRRNGGYEGLAVAILQQRSGHMHLEKKIASPFINFVQLQYGHRTSYQIPPANTLFVNGQKHTMTLDIWESYKGARFEFEDRKALSQIELPLLIRYEQDRTPRLSASLVPITKPAVITTSMGNIIREITRQDDAQTMSASFELEQLVPTMVKNKDQEQPGLELRVFAAIFPPSSNSPFSTGVASNHLLTMFRHGGRLHRVTSGGGGWGKKAGLLSLEPVTELNPEDQAEEAMPFLLQQNDETMPMPGASDVCPPGHMVQFLASWHDPQGARKSDLQNRQDRQQADSMHLWRNSDYYDADRWQATCFGTTVLPDTIEASNVSQPPGKTAPLVFEPNTFGCLTTTAMGVKAPRFDGGDTGLSQRRRWTSYEKSQDRPLDHGTLVEAPNTHIYVTQLAGRSLGPHRSLHLKTGKGEKTRFR